MEATAIFEWKMILLPLAVFFYIELLRHLNQKFAARRPISDEEYLAMEARAKSTSEYEIFRLAARPWHISTLRVDDDFRDYLIGGLLPHYVRDHIRRLRKKGPAAEGANPR